MKKILENILAYFSKAILRKYNSDVIAITGSVGKTSTKEAIYTVLQSTYIVRRNVKNYNNEIGLPLTVIGAETGGRSFFKWAYVFFLATKLILIKDKNYPNILVLEMGADRPGDIKNLCSIVRPKTAVVTEVAEAHTEFLGTIDDIAREKGALVEALPENGQAILNHDNKYVHKMQELTTAAVTFYSIYEHGDVKARNIKTNLEKFSTTFTVDYGDQQEEVSLPGVIGEHLVYSALAAIAVGLKYDLDILTITRSFASLEMPKGRMRLIKGIKNTLLIDDTYNSSPLAAKKAIEQLAKLDVTGNKYAVLGDMLELGQISEQAHQDLGHLVAMQNIDYLITVGEISLDIIRGATKANMSKDRCYNFKNSAEAGLFLQGRIATGDILLVKGSRGVVMEKVVKELMAEPQQASLLTLAS